MRECERALHRRVCTPDPCAQWPGAPPVPLPLAASGLRLVPREENALCWLFTSFQQAEPRNRPPPPALPLRPQPAPRGSFHLDREGRKLLLLVAGRDPSNDLHAWVSGSDLEMMSAFRENTALSLGVRVVEKGRARIGKNRPLPLQEICKPL